MALAATAARRLILRRGAAALAGILVSQQRGAPNIAGVQGFNSPVAASVSSQENDHRSFICRELQKEQHRQWREIQIRYDAFYNPSPDLVVLASTSQSWRASVMVTRLRKQHELADDITDRLSRVWSEPLAKVKELLATWARGLI